MITSLIELVSSIDPCELAFARGLAPKNQARDKARLVHKVSEIDAILANLGYQIEIQKIDK